MINIKSSDFLSFLRGTILYLYIISNAVLVLRLNVLTIGSN